MAGVNSFIEEKLNDSNYDIWKLGVMSYLVENNLWEYVNGEIVKNSNQWNVKEDRKALVAIYQSVTKDQLLHIRNTTTSKEAWDILKKIHEPKTSAKVDKKVGFSEEKTGSGNPSQNELYQDEESLDFDDTGDEMNESPPVMNSSLNTKSGNSTVSSARNMPQPNAKVYSGQHFLASTSGNNVKSFQPSVFGQQKIKPGQNSDGRGTGIIAQLPDLSSFKCKNMDEFFKLEEVLRDPKRFQKICRALACKIVAKGPRNFAIKCLKVILTHDVAKNFTYTGRLMENADLPPFEDTRTNAAIFDALEIKYPERNYKDEDIKATIKYWLTKIRNSIKKSEVEAQKSEQYLNYYNNAGFLVEPAVVMMADSD